MVRRVAAQVSQQVARLLRGNYIRKAPAWYNAVLDHPPLPLPPKAPPARTEYDEKPSTSSAPHKMRPKAPRPLPIYYLEDDVRRQFFRDHPFEAFRPVTLTENAAIEHAHPINGLDWKRLRQRGRNPTPEDAVRFAVNLYQHHSLSLTEAYVQAVAQFRALRSEHHIATKTAAKEAELLGAVFGPSEIESTFEKEKRGLVTFERQAEMDEGAMAARKRWKAIIDRKTGVVDQWTKGEEYVRLWREGVRPNYAPFLTQTTT